jgi:3-oxoadipate enol-lactonase
MPHHTTDDGCRLAFSIDGRRDAPALVLSNSLGTDRTLWDRQIETFADRFRVLRYDTRGHGESDAPGGAYTIERLGKDVLSLMDALGLPTAHVCGISIGGITALWLGVHAPDRVSRLVLANTAARIGSVEIWEERIGVATSRGVDALADGATTRWFTPAFRAAEPETVARFRAIMSRVPVAGYAGCCAALRDADLRSVASTVGAACLVITGAHDPATPPSAGAWLAEAIPAARLLELDAAHISNVERAPEFSSAVTHFLSA